MSASSGDGTEPSTEGAGGLVERIAKGLVDFVPHNRALGMRLVEVAAGRVTIELPWDEKLIGNPLTRVIHGGAITTLLDATCGTAVFLALHDPVPIATLDLRIDYLKPATPERVVHATAHCFKVTTKVAFVRCEAYHPDSATDLVAVANGTFIIFRGKKRGERRAPK